MRQRLDKWLWCSRLVRQREMAQNLVSQGRVRLNRVVVIKPGHAVKRDDVLTIALPQRVVVVRITNLAERREDASKARELYEDLSSPSSLVNELRA